MALSKLSGDVQRIIFRKLYNVVEISGTRLLLNPGDAVAFSSASSELRALTKAELLELLQLRKAWLEAAARKAGKRSYKKLSHAKSLQCVDTGVSALTVQTRSADEEQELEQLIASGVPVGSHAVPTVAADFPQCHDDSS